MSSAFSGGQGSRALIFLDGSLCPNSGPPNFCSIRNCCIVKLLYPCRKLFGLPRPQLARFLLKEMAVWQPKLDASPDRFQRTRAGRRETFDPLNHVSGFVEAPEPGGRSHPAWVVPLGSPYRPARDKSVCTEPLWKEHGPAAVRCDKIGFRARCRGGMTISDA